MFEVNVIVLMHSVKASKGQTGVELAGAITMLSSLGSLFMLVLPNPITEIFLSAIEWVVYY